MLQSIIIFVLQLFDDKGFWASIPLQYRGADRWRIVPLIVKVSQASGIIPQRVNVEVRDIEPNPIGGGAYGDVYRGKLGREQVIIKRLRVFTLVDNEPAKLQQLSKVRTSMFRLR